MKQRFLQLGFATLTGLVISNTAYAQQLNIEKKPYEVHGYFRVRDEQGNETRLLTAGTNTYTLEAWTEIPWKIDKPVINISIQVRSAENTQFFRSISPTPHYGLEDFFYSFEMEPRFNTIRGEGGWIIGGGVRVVKVGGPGPSKGNGILGKWQIKANGTNAVSGIFQYGGFNAMNPDGSLWNGLTALEPGLPGSTRKITNTRSLRVATMPENYAGTMLVPDINDGQIPTNNAEKDQFGINIVNGQKLGFEPFCAVGPKAPGNYVLQRSTNIIGPWTSVQTYSPRSAGSFNDREAYTNSWKNVFYRLMNESSLGILTNQSSVQSTAAKPAGQ